MGRTCYINGIPYLVTLPTGGRTENDHNNQWDHLIDCLESQYEDLDCVIHYKYRYFWCQEKESQFFCSVRGHYSARYWSYYDSSRRLVALGFRPVFIPLNPKTMQPDPSILNEIPNGGKISFGSFYINRKIIKPPQDPIQDKDIPDYVPGIDFGFGSLQIGYGFHVIKMPDWLIADRVLIKNISWNDLEDLGYVN